LSSSSDIGHQKWPLYGLAKHPPSGLTAANR
jgi:hypothetical protein